MKKSVIIGISLALGLAFVATMATAWGPGFGPQSGCGPSSSEAGIPPIPNLTAEQSAQIQALRDGFLKEIEPIQKELYAKATELQTLWSNQNPDQAAISAKQKEMADIQTSIRDKATNLRFEIRKVFTPEQLAQMPAFSQGGGFGPGTGFGPRMGMRGPMNRW